MDAPLTEDLRIRGLQAVDAFRRGDFARARDILDRILNERPGDASAWALLARTRMALGDTQGGALAVNRVIKLDPGNWQAMLLRADLFAREGDARAASSFYTAAIKRLPARETLPAQLQDEFDRAHAMRDKYLGEYESYLRSHMAERGFGEGSTRFADSLDILLGKKELYLQQPKNYYFPGLPQIQFYEREQFPWLAALEADTAAIRAELIEVLKDENAFTPYLEGSAKRPRTDPHGMVGDPSWSAFYLIKNGEIVHDNAARCPRTLAAAQRTPLCEVKGRTPSVLFSLLKPGAHIPPHHGFINVRAICHLGLVVPEKCTFRVGNDVRDWQEGKAWLFDDTIEHEAWNRSNETRVILLFDVWKPELSDAERRMVGGMFEAIDAYRGKEAEWNM